MPRDVTRRFLVGTIAFATLAALVGHAAAAPALAATREYELVVERRTIDIGGDAATALTLNGAFPGPTLRFTEGDTARIRVRNALAEETSIHWHGVLVPPGMDGVPLVSFPPIAPGATFTYEFPIRQSGTYWYHSHTHLQEQTGVYGALVIEPRDSAPGAPAEHVVLFSDWTHEDPHEVNRTLRRGSAWYALARGSAQSLLGAARRGRLGDFFARELQRMPPMDIADVAYDHFLANGRPEIALDARPGETVRLRLIDGSATTYFHLEFAGGPMTIVSADGQEVEPVEEGRLLIGVAETYDVLVRVPAAGAWELRATAHDGSGRASAWIGAGERHPAPDVPRPDLYETMGGLSLKTIFALTPAGAMGMPDAEVEAGRFDEPGMAGMAGMNDHAMPGMDHGAAPGRPLPPYPRLRAPRSTAFAPGKPLREIRLTLDGEMERYVWFLDDAALSEADDILVREGEVVRFLLINRTMMHHPLHLHGHFFRVVNGQGDRAPLKHTVDVAPMSTTVIEFDAAERGDWFFHCHLLYHMMNGMARLVHYEGYEPAPEVAAIRPGLYRDEWHAFGEAALLSTMTEGSLLLSGTRTTFGAEWEAGWQGADPDEWEILATGSRYLNGFWSLFAGADLVGAGHETEATRAVVGVRTLLPLLLELQLWADSDGGARAGLEKRLPLAPRLDLSGSVRYDTHELWEGQAGLAWTLAKSVDLLARWHSTHGFGGGVRVRF